MKQKLSILLAVVLLLSLFSGCALLGGPSSRKSLISDDFRVEGDGYFLTAEDGRVYVNYRPEQTAQVSLLSAVQPCVSIQEWSFSPCATLEDLLVEALSGTVDVRVYKDQFFGDSEKVLLFDSRYLERVVPSEKYELWGCRFRRGALFARLNLATDLSSDVRDEYPGSFDIYSDLGKNDLTSHPNRVFPGYDVFPESGKGFYIREGSSEELKWTVYTQEVDGLTCYVMERHHSYYEMRVYFQRDGVNWSIAVDDRVYISPEKLLSCFSIEPFTTNLEKLLKKAS